jgi:hypothetical protein
MLALIERNRFKEDTDRIRNQYEVELQRLKNEMYISLTKRTGEEILDGSVNIQRRRSV